MFNPEIFAVNFARTVALLREREPNKEQQKASLRAVYALISLSSATVRLYDGVLSVDDTVIADDVPYTAVLREQLAGHAIAEVAVSRGASATELLTLLKVLAVDVGSFGPGEGVAQRLAAAGVAGLAVLGARREVEEPERRAPSVTQAFELASIREAEARAEEVPKTAPAPPTPPSPPSRPQPEPVQAPAGFEPTTFVAVAPAARAAPAPEPRVPPPERLPATPPAAAGVKPAPQPLAAPHGVPANTPTGVALAVVTRDPYGAGILDRLSDLAAEVASDLRDGRLEMAVQAIAAVIGIEPGAPEGTPRNSYGIVLRRMLSRDALKRVALLLTDARFAPIATAVVQRSGGEGAEVLVELLTQSDVPTDRKAFLAALRVIPKGTTHFVTMLGQSQWVVVKNVADLLGEMRVEEAVPELGELLLHYEPRVRRAAAIALAKIGTAATVEPLMRALREGTPELRALVAGSIGGRQARALAMPIVGLAESEAAEDVLCEYYRALGRIGTPEAVEALGQAAAPGGRVFGRRATAPRIAAVEALRAVGTDAARRAIESLSDDRDRAVKEAANRALAARGGERPAAR